jgi:hypothetical protein
MRPLPTHRRGGALLLAAGLFLAGCSGGGGPGTGPGPQTIAPPPPPAPAPQPPSLFDTPEYRRSDAAVASNVLPAWSEGASGAGVIVATLDSGIAAQSPEFAGRIHSSSRDVTGSGRPITDEGGHGTSVAGVLAAARDNQGIVGIAPQASLAVFRADRPGSCGSSDGCRYNDSALAQGIDAAISAGARIINMSLGGSGASPGLQGAFARAGQAGVVLVISAGNDSTSQVDGLALSALQAGNPATVLVVGSMTASRTISDFSNRAGGAAGNYLVALGERVRSFNQNGDAFLYSGTSYSAPQVSGAIALLAQAFPQMTGQQLVQILLRSADEAGAPGPDSVYGSGILNIGRAFQPIGQMSLAGTPIPVSAAPGGNGQMGMAMGDGAALGAALGPVPVADSFGRLFALDLAPTLRAAHAGRLSARLAAMGSGAGGTLQHGAGPLALAATSRGAAVAPGSFDPFRFAPSRDSHLGLAQRGLDPHAAAAGEALSARLELGPLRLAAARGPGARLAGSAPGEHAFLLLADGLAPAEDMARRTLRAAAAGLTMGGVRLGVSVESGEADKVAGRGLDRLREDRASMALGWSAGPARLDVLFSDIRTEGGFLGARMGAALGITGGDGLEAGGAFGLALGAIDLRVAGAFGRHTPRHSGAGLLRQSGDRIETGAWSLSATAPLGPGRARLGVAQPVAVTGGLLAAADPLGQAPPRAVVLAPPARERAIEAGWKGSAGSLGEIAIGAFHRAHAGHHQGLSDSGGWIIVSRRW